MSDRKIIYLDDALDAAKDWYNGLICRSFRGLEKRLKSLPSAQPETHGKRTETHACDLISRRAVIDVIAKRIPSPSRLFAEGVYLTEEELFKAQDPYVDCIEAVEALPSAQPEPLADAYTKAVWTWLLNYQIKAAELKGRYTPYEVLSWVANDWRKEHEGSD